MKSDSDFEALFLAEKARRERTEAVLNIVARLNSQLEMAVTLTAVSQIASEILDAPIVCIRLYDEEKQALCLAHTRGVPGPLPKQHPFQYDPEDEAASPMPRIEIIPDVELMPDFPDIDYYRALGVRTIAHINMLLHQLYIGCLHICIPHEVRDFSDEEMELLAGVGEHAAVAIHRTQLYEQVQQQTALLKKNIGRRTKALESSNREKEEALRALRTYTEELQTQNAELDAFAHTVAHDLHSPLSVMIGLSDLLLDDEDPLPPEVQIEYLKRIMRQGHKMHTIVNEILLLASIRKAEVQVAPITNMSHLVNEALKRVTRLIDELEPEIIMPEVWPVVLGYAPWIEEVWANYLSNGIKYGGRPPRLEIRAATANGMVRYGVKDNGNGLSMEEQARLFTPFTRLHQVRIGSHGLGLSIVHRILTKLDGRVGVVSQPNQSSFFYFELPLVEEA